MLFLQKKDSYEKKINSKLIQIHSLTFEVLFPEDNFVGLIFWQPKDCIKSIQLIFFFTKIIFIHLHFCNETKSRTD